MVQFGGLIGGVVLGYTVNQELLAAHFDQNVAGVASLLMAVAGLALPDTLLAVIRRSQRNAARDEIYVFIEKTLRNYPDEVEHCGGVRVLADRVELEALVHVLEDKFPPPEDAPLPPLKP
jgi:hypothetical protein